MCLQRSRNHCSVCLVIMISEHGHRAVMRSQALENNCTGLGVPSARPSTVKKKLGNEIPNYTNQVCAEIIGLVNRDPNLPLACVGSEVQIGHQHDAKAVKFGRQALYR